MASSGINISLKSYDSIFQNDEQRNSEEIKPVPLSELKPFEQQPFKVLLDESMDELVDSIKQSGVLTPVIARPHKDGGYEILCWRTDYGGDWAADDTMEIWDGE